MFSIKNKTKHAYQYKYDSIWILKKLCSLGKPQIVTGIPPALLGAIAQYCTSPRMGVEHWVPDVFSIFFYILVLVFHVQFCCWICDMSVSWATYKSPQTTSSSLHRLFLHRSDLSYTLFQFLKEIPVGYSSKLFPPPFWADLLLGFLAPKICATPRSISDTWLRSTWAWPLPRPRCSNRMMGRWVMRESGVSPWRVQVRTIIFIRKRLKKIVL